MKTKIEEHAGFWGTDELAQKYADETPGQSKALKLIKRLAKEKNPK